MGELIELLREMFERYGEILDALLRLIELIERLLDR